MEFLSSLVAVWSVVSALAAPDASPPLRVRVIDCAAVSSSVMGIAEQTVTQAFRSAGVRAVWREESAKDFGPGEPEVTVILLTNEMTKRKTASEMIPATAMGTAAPAAKRAWIFIDRVQDFAATQHASVGRLLGIVIAHEVAHVAAGLAHSSEGIMDRNLRLNSVLVHQFNADEGASLRAALRISAAPTAVAQMSARARR